MISAALTDYTTEKKKRREWEERDRKNEKQKKRNQDILDSLLKRCLPVIWNYQDIFLGSDEDEINKFVPEGVDDAAMVTLSSGDQITMWKERKFKVNFNNCNLEL